MTRQQRISRPGAVGPRLRTLLSWTACLATVLIALAVCSQLEPRTHDAHRLTAGAATLQAASIPIADGCEDHPPGHQDHCAAPWQHTPKALAPTPDLDAPIPVLSQGTPPPLLTAGGTRHPSPVAVRDVDLHALQVQRT